MKFHCDSVKLTVKKAVGRGIECAEAHSWQNKSFLKKKPSLIRTKVKKSCRGRGRMRRGAQLAKQKFFEKKPWLTRTKVRKSCRGRDRMRRGAQLAKQKFFEKKTFAHKNEGQKKL
ncbi:MAG TPA: hypothetical protein PLP80_10070 [Niabella sp.]|nr:hypothetical protein [Niabella sp.]HRB88752.1 hypothetical protein [Niabella sp.]